MKFQIKDSEFTFKTFDYRETEKVGEILGSQLLPGDVIALIGELGTGKTCFTRGLAFGLGIDRNVPIVSPSFTIINEYPGAVPLYHFDFYRLNNLSEVLDLGYEEYFFGKGVTVIEWGEKVESILPEEHLKVKFYFQDDNVREIKIKGYGKLFNQRIRESWELLFRSLVAHQ
ncbi:MAG: tRNA (adenosine(37)-N6)-threonylcarbamoyltransferase complex ATPase subunit type 1 TsaE [Deltaproteobacteria bacterium]|nr:MAG: tRNA (adenosine(37)-N6)-threonylcarbamoyltransferase complex ATPase subunit type 1 TsaE [Deltaproteobacteria bacterium]